MLAATGTSTLVELGGSQLPAIIPHLVVPLKTALATERPAVMLRALAVVRALASSSPAAGRCLVGYYRHLLPPLDRCAGGSWRVAGERTVRGGGRPRCVGSSRRVRPALHFPTTCPPPPISVRRHARLSPLSGSARGPHSWDQGEALHDAVMATLEALRRSGGPEALRALRHYIPSFHRL